MKKSLYLFCFTICSLFVWAQEVQSIKGKIVDSQGYPLVDAMVEAKKSGTTAEVDQDGNFEIKAIKGEELLVSSLSLGEKTMKATAAFMDVQLGEVSVVDEVVVVGYGQRNKKDLTTVIAQIKGDELAEQPVADVISAAQGKVAGAQVVTSPTPGKSAKLTIRGAGTVLGGRDPLYVVDGVILSSIDGLNSYDIETFDVLKDATAAAIYGSQAANGVVIITTKQGKKNQKPMVELNTYTGFKQVQNMVEMANASEYIRYMNAAYDNDVLKDPTMTQPVYFNENYAYDTDWYDEILKTGTYSNTDVSIRGGSEAVRYMLSASYYDEKGIVDGFDYNRVTLRSNNIYNISDKLKITQNINLSNSHSTPKSTGALSYAYNQSPLVPVKFEDGYWGAPIKRADGTVGRPSVESFNNVGNPVADLYYHNEKNSYFKLLGSVLGEYKITPNLTYSSRFGMNYYVGKGGTFIEDREKWETNALNAGQVYPSGSYENTLSTWRSSNFDYVLDNFLNFNKKYGAHDIDATLGMAYQKEQGEELKLKGHNIPDGAYIWSMNFTDPESQEIEEHKVINPTSKIGYFGRLQYIYDGKYLLTASMRRDGSSRFQEGHKWGNFPSVGAGWVISRENFLVQSEFINFLKIRGGWGRLGNDRVPINAAQYETGLDYPFGNVIYPGFSYTRFYADDLSWEITEETSLGLDFEFLSSRLSGSVDVYHKLNTNTILEYDTEMTTGGEGMVVDHFGEVLNQGVEVVLQWKDTVGEDFTYWLGGNYTYNKNNLESVRNPVLLTQSFGGYAYGKWNKKLLLDNPIGTLYVYEAKGYTANGDLNFVDQNGDGAINDLDRINAGSVMPKHYFGFNFGFAYNGFDFSTDLYGQAGNKVFNAMRGARLTGENVEAEIANDFWTPTNTDATHPRPLNGIPEPSTYLVEDGSFVRVNNLTLGYTIKELAEGISSLRLYFTAVNPLVWQKYSGFSSEVYGDGDTAGNPMGSLGNDINTYPTTRSYVFGVNVKF